MPIFSGNKADEEQLRQASKTGDCTKVAELLKTVDVNATDVGTWSAVWYASLLDYTDVILLLVNAGADLNGSDRFNRTLLQLVCSDGLCAVARILLDAGADATARDKWGHSALDIATSAGHSAVVTLLKQYLPSGSPAA